MNSLMTTHLVTLCFRLQPREIAMLDRMVRDGHHLNRHELVKSILREIIADEYLKNEEIHLRHAQ